MISLKFEKVNSHIVVDHEGLNMLIDTGLMVSIADKPIDFIDRKYSALNSVMGVNIDMISKLAGFKIDAIIGLDILSNYKLRIRWNDGFLDFGQDVPDGKIVQKLSYDICVIFPIKIDGIKTSGILDTGASISYVSDELVKNKTIINQKEDFYPLIGKFTTSIYEIPVSIYGRKTINLEFGILPGMLKIVHGIVMSSIGIKAILGTQLLTKYNCTIDWDEEVISWDNV